jgi:hypothetical protein
MSFLLLLRFTLQHNWRNGQNRFCLEVRKEGSREGQRPGGRNDLNNICTHEYMDKEKINCKFENIDLFLLILQNAFLQLGIHSYSPVPILVDDTLSFRYLM